MYLAVDVGATKTLLAVFNKDGKITEQTKFPTPQVYSDFITNLTKQLAKLTVKKFDSAVVAIPGRIDRQHGVGIAFGNLPWQMVPVQDDLEKVLGCPIVLENDAKLAGLYEAIVIKKDFKKVLYITISTGIGGALIIDGKIDPNFADMEVGQILLEHQGKLTDWEDFGSGRAFKKKFGKLVSDTPSENAEAWYWLARNIAIGLIDLVATLNPEVIVLGGGVGAHLEKFEARLLEELKIYENPLISTPVIRKATRPEEAVVYGCYELIKQSHATKTN